MGLTYLGVNSETGNFNSWLDITREERLFCSHLYHDVRSGGLERDFVGWLKSEGTWQDELARQDLKVDQEWEIAYEVCFYRDLLKSRQGKTARQQGYPSKRTFDLCLFSEENIVIVEAKVHEALDSVQLGHFVKYVNRKGEVLSGDKQLVRHLAGGGNRPSVCAVALASSKYLLAPHGGVRQVADVEAVITWQRIHRWANTSIDGYQGIYSVADDKYGKPTAFQNGEPRLDAPTV